jgi:hypothetical protein
MRSPRRPLRGTLMTGVVSLALALSSILAACQQPSTPTPTSPPAAAAQPSVAASAGAAGGLVAPVRGPQTLTVLNGYDNPPPGQTCPLKGYGHDHCGDQEDGLDLVPSNLTDLLVLAPVAGTVKWDETAPTQGLWPNV